MMVFHDQPGGRLVLREVPAIERRDHRQQLDGGQPLVEPPEHWWELISQQYDQLIRYATAINCGSPRCPDTGLCGS